MGLRKRRSRAALNTGNTRGSTTGRRTRTRRRERQMKRFKSAGQAQRFLAAHDQINNLFHLRRDHVTADQHRADRIQAFQTWAEVTGVAALA